MKRLLPRRTELAIFAALAIVCAVIVSSLTVQEDLGLSVMAMPIFICAAIMGMRRSGQLAHIREKVERAESE